MKTAGGELKWLIKSLKNMKKLNADIFKKKKTEQKENKDRQILDKKEAYSHFFSLETDEESSSHDKRCFLLHQKIHKKPKLKICKTKKRSKKRIKSMNMFI